MLKDLKNFKKFLIIGFIILLMASILSGCSSEKKVAIVLADPGWDSIRIHNAVAAFIADKAYGISSSETPGTTPVTYEGLLNGQIDVYMEIWSENIPNYQADVDAGKFLEMSINFDDNKQGIYVPRYVVEGDAARGIQPMAPGLKTVADLIKYKDVFKDEENPSKGRVYGAIPGWAIDRVMAAKISRYFGGEYVYFRPGSDAALAAAFTAAIEKGNPIVGYNWEPNWLTGKYDFILLEDEPYTEKGYQEGTTACPSIAVTVGVSKGLPQKSPELAEFLKKYKTSSKLTSEAMAHMKDTGADYKATAKWFLKKNDDLLNQWLPTEKAKAVRDALAKE